MTTIITIPTYNRAKLLKRAIDSVFAQTDEDWQLLIYDDGSTDGTQEMLETIDDERISHYYFVKNTGLVSTFNELLDTALVSGAEYWSWLASDDELHPEFVEIHKKYLARENVTVTYSDYVAVTGNREKYINLYTDPAMIPYIMTKRVCISLASICVKIDVLREIKKRYGVFCNPRFKHMNDWDFLIKLSETTNAFQHIPSALAKYHIHPDMGSSGIYFPTAPQSEIARQFLLERASMKR